MIDLLTAFAPEPSKTFKNENCLLLLFSVCVYRAIIFTFFLPSPSLRRLFSLVNFSQKANEKKGEICISVNECFWYSFDNEMILIEVFY